MYTASPSTFERKNYFQCWFVLQCTGEEKKNFGDPGLPSMDKSRVLMERWVVQGVGGY
jgi:hypothetical protein